MSEYKRMTKKQAENDIFHELVELTSYRIGDQDGYCGGYISTIEALYAQCFISKKIYKNRFLYIYHVMEEAHAKGNEEDQKRIDELKADMVIQIARYNIEI